MKRLTDDKSYDELTAGIVDQFYEMDPETEDVAREGAHLQNGMVVLIENPWDRAKTPDDMALLGAHLSDARMVNRWCTITDLEPGDEITSFIGVYEDGVKRQRRVPSWAAWLYKKDSLPAEDFRNTIYGIDGREVWEVPEAETSEWLLKVTYVNRPYFKVKLGSTGETMTASEYLLKYGTKKTPQDEVIDSRGTTIFIGSTKETVKFLKGRPQFDRSELQKVKHGATNMMHIVAGYLALYGKEES